jgi:hypothetical protein
MLLLGQMSVGASLVHACYGVWEPAEYRDTRVLVQDVEVWSSCRQSVHLGWLCEGLVVDPCVGDGPIEVLAPCGTSGHTPPTGCPRTIVAWYA